MFVTRVITDDGLRLSEAGFDLDIRLPWYRSLPLSTVNVAELKIDGQVIPASAITFEVNGKAFSLGDLKAHPEEWWFVLDSAYLHVSGTKLQPGTEHDVSATIGIKPPYIPGFFRLTECNKRLAVK
jgi:hypothetical protein